MRAKTSKAFYGRKETKGDVKRKKKEKRRKEEIERREEGKVEDCKAV